MSVFPGSVRRTITYASTELNDVDGILESVSTSATAVDLTPEDYDGAVVTSSGAWIKLPRSVTITLSEAIGSYDPEVPIVLTGKRGGIPVTEELTPSTADGGETLRGWQVFDQPPDIAIPAQVDTSGAIEIGVGDIGTPQPGERFAMVRLAAAGQINVAYGEASTDPTDSYAALANAIEPIAPTRILTSPTLAVPTAVGLTLYLD